MFHELCHFWCCCWWVKILSHMVPCLLRFLCIVNTVSHCLCAGYQQRLLKRYLYLCVLLSAGGYLWTYSVIFQVLFLCFWVCFNFSNLCPQLLPDPFSLFFPDTNCFCLWPLHFVDADADNAKRLLNPEQIHLTFLKLWSFNPWFCSAPLAPVC